MIYQTISREKITVSTTAKTLTDGAWNADGVVYAVVQVKNADIIQTTDGTTPVAASDTGEEWYEDATYEIWGFDDLKGFQAVRLAGTDALLEVTYKGHK